MPITREVSNSRAGESGINQIESSYGPRYTETLYTGRVVGTGSTYIGDGESTYWAVVAERDGSFEQVWYGSDRSSLGRAAIDAPPALLAAWADENTRRAAERAREYAVYQAERDQAAAAEYARTPRVGSIVRVVRGRKVPIGIEANVFWVGDSNWGPRVGIELSEEVREFIATANVEVISQPVEK